MHDVTTIGQIKEIPIHITFKLDQYLACNPTHSNMISLAYQVTLQYLNLLKSALCNTSKFFPHRDVYIQNQYSTYNWLSVLSINRD